MRGGRRLPLVGLLACVVDFAASTLPMRRLDKDYSLGDTANRAVELDKFHGPLLEGSDVALSSSSIKRTSGCDMEWRTGTWVTKECTQHEIVAPFRYLSSERWAALDADHAWDDAKARWLFCDKPSRNITFSTSIAQFFHTTEGAVSRQFISRL